ncbi:MAG: alanine-glyoxylate transaminase / serine-glyoxylate transaminase / serine-pyruvate transaminase [Thermosediminibacterales bacterium]|nr:alanine-glyoxylate transaminase / serine-glyoxylate transaminase / serine-pyruvate transaminase [Thermosediminibacterales bacterium]MDK2835940.1 alanine-glyoxylate transaminase / serine-glyoxylate transaminase / serine-pyruvate transaminase [Thermosediminibacterales bacterium]
MEKTYLELNPSQRILLGPGPSNCHPRVLKAMATPLVGHLDPDFLDVMNDVMELLREVFQTKNQLTIPMSGTGSAGMETTLVNLLEPGDKAVICINGLFGQRMADIVERCGAEVIKVEGEWGDIIKPEQVESALKGSGAKLVGIVHAETSTGVRQPLEDIAKIAHENGALLLADTVTSLGGLEVKIDEWGVDVAYSGTQKCLSCPPGLSPVTFNEKAREVIRNRKTKVQSWYLDLTMIENYWGQERFYHHTAPITMNYALREALRLIHEEGLQQRFARHQKNSDAFVAGIEAMGLSMLPPKEYRLPSLNAVKIPDGVDDVKVRKMLLDKFNIEIGGGLGVLKGKIWRVGLMGYSSSQRNVMLLLAALETALKAQGYSVKEGAGIAAAAEVYGL